MAIGRTDDRYYQEIADAIREKNGSQIRYKPREMPGAIKAIQVATPITETLEINNNGSFNVLNYAMAEVNVPASAVTYGNKTITENGVFDVTTYKNVVVSVPTESSSEGIIPTGTLTVYENGSYNCIAAFFFCLL